jgi:hypothetical protein
VSLRRSSESHAQLFGKRSRVQGGYQNVPIDHEGVPGDSLLNTTPFNSTFLVFHLASR